MGGSLRASEGIYDPRRHLEVGPSLFGVGN
jgi:hypothetical protein